MSRRGADEHRRQGEVVSEQPEYAIVMEVAGTAYISHDLGRNHAAALWLAGVLSSGRAAAVPAPRGVQPSREQFLEGLLGGRLVMPSRAVRERAREAGISDATHRRAQSGLSREENVGTASESWPTT